MNRQSKIGFGLLLAALGGLIGLAGLWAQDAEPKKEPAKAAAAAPVKAKPLSDQVKKGLTFLVNQQHENGGWGQGGGWRTNVQGNGRVEGGEVADPPDVANTCMAVLALIRAGNTPKEGDYAKNVARGVAFICSKIEKADKDSMYVTDVKGTQVQSKIGPYVDTFLATMVLAELKGKMPDADTEKRLVASLDKTIAKIEKNQKKDGTFAGNEGWASVLSQGLASKGLNRAAQNGANVQVATLGRDNAQSVQGLDTKTGKFGAVGAGGSGTVAGRPVAAEGPKVAGAKTEAPATTAPSDAGVTIYNASARAAGLQETVNSLKKTEKQDKEIVADAKAPQPQKEEANKRLELLKDAEKAQQVAVRGLAEQAGDANFVRGFGNNGGEEFLSFMNISETLICKGGDEWAKWDKAVTDNLNRIQDKDGGWSGHHCITGRTFCTAGALLTLMADRAPIPAQAKAEPRK